MSDPHLHALTGSPYTGLERLLLADRFLSYSSRLGALRSFLELDELQRVDIVLHAMLTKMFRLLYTKEKVYASFLGCSLEFLTNALSIAAIGVFAKAPKHGHSKSDVLVTYILLCSIVAMELLPHVPTVAWSTVAKVQHQHTALISVAQHNIISFALRKRRPTKMMLVAALVGGDDLVNKFWHVGERSSGLEIVTVVHRQLEEGWKEYINDATTFRRFNSFRGQWTLSRRGCRDLLEGRPALGVLRRCLQQVPFDESVLMWLIATNLCFHHPDAASPPQGSMATVAMHISNYMAYLLLLRPEMMMPGTRRDLFTSACYDLAYMLKYNDGPPLDEQSLAQGIVRKARRFSWLFADGLSPLLPKACRLAEALMELGDEEARWKLVEGVWVEMLCYSASRCRGYLHAQILGQGRELLSYIWLLLSHMGMETYADRFQRPQAPKTKR